MPRKHSRKNKRGGNIFSTQPTTNYSSPSYSSPSYSSPSYSSSNGNSMLGSLGDTFSNWSSKAKEGSGKVMDWWNALGGRGSRKNRKNKSRKLRGGSNIMDTVTSVSNLKVAEPTYWIKGGKKTRYNKK